MHRKVVFLVLAAVIVFASPSFAVSDDNIPGPLRPWVDWVLHGHEEELLCTPDFDDASALTCDWPTALELDIRSRQGSFAQSWFLEHERWVQLPGDERHWPQQVTVNGKPAVVLKQQGVPKVRLLPGTHRINGTFRWPTIPEFLQIDARTGLLSLAVNGTPVPFPSLDDSGRIWLHDKGEKETVVEDRLQVQAFRLIDDRIPARIVLHLELDVAGSAREIMLGAPFAVEEFNPVSLESSLPARLEKDGRIRLQVRPGQWNLNLTVRHIGPLQTLRFTRPNDDVWPGQEVWVFAKRDNRIVEIEGVTSIDPQQTALPDLWRTLPAYRLEAGDTMVFKLIKRGDPEPAPDQLSLQRQLWLRFDGSGYAIQDRISGKKTSDWRLEMAPPMILGRVAVDGRERFITRMADSENAGIELRNGLVDIIADSEYRGPVGTIPALGWVHDFQQVDARLFLPPGYRLLHASGIDNIPDTWLNRWTLLDLFVLLIFTIALARLFSVPLAAVGFVTLALLYHEPDAPRWIWLAILVGVALVRSLPDGRFLKAAKVFRLAVFVLLVIIAVPFSVQQLRVGIYPQLERPWQVLGQYRPAAPGPARETSGMGEPAPAVVEEAVEMEDKVASVMKKPAAPGLASSMTDRRYSSSKPVAQYDPSMVNQTGPGIPAWQWNSVRMGWSGPVRHDQQIGLLLLGPKANLVLAFARVALMVVLALGLVGVTRIKGKRFGFPDPRSFLPVLLLLLLPLLTPAAGRAAEIPSPELFEELRERLLEKEDCFPGCADVMSMSIAIDRSELAVEFEVAAQSRVAIPLPGNPKHWLAATVSLDGRPATAIDRSRDGLWLIVPPGRHRVALRNALPPNDTLQLSLPLKPHALRIRQEGWTSEGINPDGSIENQLQFRRIVREDKEVSRILETGVLPPFVLVERFLQLGLDWRVTTRIQRISPPGSAILLDYPLLPGEAVVTAGVTVKEGKARVNIDPEDRSFAFESVLEKTSELTLRHAETDDWTEIWQVDASPIFHLEYTGIPVILHQVGNRWAPKWHPWPGEELRLTISRPEGVAGQTVTIDKSRLIVRPGQRATDATLEFSLQSSQGGQHVITLPEESRLQEVQIDGRVQSIRQEGRAVPLPIRPGRQEISLKWQEPSGITASYQTPSIDFGLVNANTEIELHLPENRWPLLVGGPAIGPAVLFWSEVLIIVLIAFGLARSSLTHLKFYQLLLLGIGMSQSHLLGILLVVGWLVALNFRQKVEPDIDPNRFNLMQALLGVLTVLALLALVFAISQGLLGHPDMSIVGNGSSRNLLRWYQDYNSGTLPRAWLLSVHIFWYRLAMLAWALWLSFTLTGILRYGWQVFSKPALWYPTARKEKKPGRGKKSAGSPAEEDATFEFVEEDAGKDREKD